MATFTDSNGSDTASDFTATINWGDGTTTAGTVSGSAGAFAVAGGHTYADEGSDTLSVTFTDTLNNTTTTPSGTVTVAEGDTLVAHAATFSASAGTPFSGTVATFTDTTYPNNVAGDFSATINWGDGTPTTTGTVGGGSGSAFTVSGSHTYAATGIDTVTVVLDDDPPGTATATATSTADVTGQFTGQVSLASATEGTALPASTTVATFTDSNGSDTASDFTATINWGDGTTTAGTVSGSAGAFAVAGGHTYADEGSDTLSVTFTDTLNSTTTTPSGTVTVAEGDTLVAHAATFSASAGTPFSGTVATFTDTTYPNNVAGDFSATINWGDGTPTTTGTVGGGSGSPFTVSGSHTYAATGIDTVTVVLDDDPPGTATATATSTVTVVNPAVAAFQPVMVMGSAGTFTPSGANIYTLDFGTVTEGMTAPTAVIDVVNAATAPADTLTGSFSLTGTLSAFLNSGLGPVGPLAAGAASGQIDLSLKTASAGSFSETLSLAATGSHPGFSTETLTVEGTVVAPSGQVFNLTTGPDTFVEPAGSHNNLVIATTNTLSAGDDIDAGNGGNNTLALQGAGVFNMTLPTMLADIDAVTAQEGQPSYTHNGVTYASQVETVTLRPGLDAVIDVSPAVPNPGNPQSPMIVIVGAAGDSSTINLAGGNDSVTLGSPLETVNGGGSNDTFNVNQSTVGATIAGGSGTNLLEVTGGGTLAMGPSITQIADVLLVGTAMTPAYSFTANALSGLLVDDLSTATPDTLIAGGSGQTLTGGGVGKLVMDAANNAGVTAKDGAAVLNGDTFKDLVNGDMIDVAGLAYSAGTTLGFTFNPGPDTTTMSVLAGGVQKTAITLLGQYAAANFASPSADSAGTGTLITLVHELNLSMPH